MTMSKTTDGIADDVREFVIKKIDSIAQLEALLLLKGSPGTYWNLASIASRLYISESKAAEVTTALNNIGVVAMTESGFRFSCEEDLERLIDRLAETYRAQLIPVTNLIHSKPPRFQEFADAFNLRRRP